MISTDEAIILIYIAIVILISLSLFIAEIIYKALNRNNKK